MSIINNHLSIIRGEVLFLNAMKKSKSLFSQLYKKAILMALWTKAKFCDKVCFGSKICQEHKADQNLCALCALSGNKNNCVNLCKSVSEKFVFFSCLFVVNFSSCLLCLFVAENTSIKMNKLCKTNPI